MKLLISDTADVVIKRKDGSGHVFVTAETQLGSIAASLGIDEAIFGGIGNKKLSNIRGQKEVSASVRNAFYDQEFLAMSQGVEISEDGKVNVYKREDALEVDTSEVTIVGTPVEDLVTIRNQQGITKQVTITNQAVTVPADFAEDGDKISVTYLTEVTGDVTTLDAEKFSVAHTLEMHTIGYDPDTNLVVMDIYIQLDHVIPSGEFELSFENGNAIAPEINFDAMVAPGTTEIGRIVQVARE